VTSQKDFKRVVRARMQKTGESYTAARASLLRKPVRSTSATPTRPDYAKLAGMSDAAIKANTGCEWETWVKALDYKKAWTWPHRDIAKYVKDTFKTRDWWTQTVATGYERIKGLREIGQRRGGTFEASRSKTLPVPVGRLYRAFADARMRRRWLAGVKLKIRTATPDKSVRITWDDGTPVDIWLTAKGDSKAAVAVSHRKLASRDDANRRKEYWGERLDALAKIFTA
jgi:uncharacterized protein YndB with AHSA1/START domain